MADIMEQDPNFEQIRRKQRTPSLVLPRLFVGTRLHAYCLEILRENNISHVLCVAQSVRYPSEDTVRRELVSMSDYGESNLETDVKEKAMKFIREGLDTGTGVLIHCRRVILE